jgi:hypothetical protein
VDASQIPPGLAAQPTQQTREPGTSRGYTRLAVMDGKTITHRVRSYFPILPAIDTLADMFIKYL